MQQVQYHVPPMAKGATSGMPTADDTILPQIRAALQTSDLCLVEHFLLGDTVSDPIRAHNLIKAVHACGEDSYPTLWEKLLRYVNSPEYQMLERVSRLPSATSNQRHPFGLQSLALHLRTASYVEIHSLQLGYIHFRNASLDGSTRQDCWNECLVAL